MLSVSYSYTCIIVRVIDFNNHFSSLSGFEIPNQLMMGIVHGCTSKWCSHQSLEDIQCIISQQQSYPVISYKTFDRWLFLVHCGSSVCMEVEVSDVTVFSSWMTNEEMSRGITFWNCRLLNAKCTFMIWRKLLPFRSRDTQNS